MEDKEKKEYTPDSDYNSQYRGMANDVMRQYLNRDPFSYDFNADALYQQYKDKYIQQGKMAMQDAMGQAAALTGGYGNSYAATVGNQAYQAHLQNLNDIIPELYQLAYDRYEKEGQNMLNKYSLLDAADTKEYGLWNDKIDKANANPSGGDNTTGGDDKLSGIRDKLSGITDNTDLANYLDGLEGLEIISPEEADALYVEFKQPDKAALQERSWTRVSDGGTNWFWGIDGNAEVKDQYDNTYRLDKLVDALVAEGMDESEAKEYVIKLQKSLGI